LKKRRCLARAKRREVFVAGGEEVKPIRAAALGKRELKKKVGGGGKAPVRLRRLKNVEEKATTIAKKKEKKGKRTKEKKEYNHHTPERKDPFKQVHKAKRKRGYKGDGGNRFGDKKQKKKKKMYRTRSDNMNIAQEREEAGQIEISIDIQQSLERREEEFNSRNIKAEKGKGHHQNAHANQGVRQGAPG